MPGDASLEYYFTIAISRQIIAFSHNFIMVPLLGIPYFSINQFSIGPF